MNDDPRESHPRPIFARTGWVDLCGQWGFAYDDDGVGASEHWHELAEPFDRLITVPFPPESAQSGIADPGFHPIAWYRKCFRLDRPAPGRRVILHFGAVDYTSSVWVNGHLVAEHEGGQTPFLADITDALADEGEQTLVLRAIDDPADLEQPRGKQDWQLQPHVIWYKRTTGIWQPVWLEIVPDVHLHSLRLTTLDPLGTVRAELQLTGWPHAEAEVEIELSLGGRTLARQVTSVTGRVLVTELRVSDPRETVEPHALQWSPENPTLCDVTVVVRTADAADTVHSYVGFRTVGTDAGRILLNGLPYYLRLALAQGYWPESHLAAPDAASLRREVELVKSLGLNGVRVHQKFEDPRFLYWCDRLGVLVIQDPPAPFTFTPRSLSRVTQQWQEIIERDSGHPCVIAWIAFNESWGVQHVATDDQQKQAVRALYHLIKALDPTRLVVGNDGWEYVCGDFLGIHDYTHDPTHIAERYGTLSTARASLHTSRPGGRRLAVDEVPAETPILLTEFGGFTHATDKASTWPGYGVAETQDDLTRRLQQMMAYVHDARGLAGFCYTQLADTEQERNGLLTEARKPKLDPDRIAAIMQGAAGPLE